MVCKVLAPALALGLLVACSSGGGGDDDGVEPVVYNGPTTAAALGAENAEALISDAFFGVDLVLALVDDDPLSGASPTLASAGAQAEAPALRALAQALDRRDSFSERRLPAEVFQDQVGGLCGGTLETRIDVNTDTGVFVATETYRDFNDCEVVIDGRVDINGRVDVFSLALLTLKVETRLLSVSGEGFAISMTGQIETDNRSLPLRTLLTMNIRDDFSQRVFRYENYQVSVDPSASNQTLVSGRYYDPQYGYLQLSTAPPLVYYEEWPETGAFRGQGADNRAVQLVALGQVLYRIEADLDGDGVFETVYPDEHWPGRNTTPQASAQAYQYANIECPAPLTGSGFDFDGDPLSFHWSMDSAPPGSAAVIEDADAAQARLVADLVGAYQVSLTTNDGYDDSSPPQTLNIEVGGGLFCSATGFALIQPGSWAEQIAVADLNADGRDDLVIATSFYFDPDNDYRLKIYLQTASGELAPPQSLTFVGGLTGRPQALAIADFNDDDRVDIALAVQDLGIEIFHQQADGQWLGSRLADTLGTTHLLALDFNGDLRTDLVSLQGTALVLLEQTAGGGFSPGAPLALDIATVTALRAGDLNGDGRQDLVGGGRNVFDGRDFVLPGLAEGGFGAAQYHDWPDQTIDDLALGDLNADGRQDRVLSVPGRLLVQLQQADGQLGAVVEYPFFSGGSGAVAVASIDGQSGQDVLATYGGGALGVFSGSVSGVLGDFELYWTPNGINSLVVGDLNGDAWNDVLGSVHELGAVYFAGRNR